jgi:Fic family protein
MFIYERENWTDFRWDNARLALPLEVVSKKVGLLYGRLSGLGFDSQLSTMAENLTWDVVHSSEIEGIRLNADEVRSSIARRLGIENVKFTAPSHYVDSVVAVMMDAVEHYDRPLSIQLLCSWQAAFFPSGFSEGSQIEVGKYRTHEEHIVSGMFGREHIHYIAPAPEKVDEEMNRFIRWFNADMPTPSIIRSAVAHLWFVSIHPFEDGNGRLARILSDMMLARGDNSRYRFYNISSEINRDKKHYYEVLEKTQHGDGDITEWLLWYMETLTAAIDNAIESVSETLNKSKFWQRAAQIQMNERQRTTLNRFLNGYEAKITTKNWADMNHCSKDTANRDIQDLVIKKVLREDIPGAKRPSYSIIYNPDDLTQYFTDIKIENGWLTAIYKGMPVKEHLLPLDAERYERGDLPLRNLLDKYCSYLVVGKS